MTKQHDILCMTEFENREPTVATSQPKQGSSIYDLDTPATLIDLDRLERNIREWQASMGRCAVNFRPHIKTHKIPEIARMQVAAGAVGIVCAKVSEAEPFATAGIEDICVAYPVVGEMKWRRLAELAKNTKRLTVNCDCEEAAVGLSESAARAGVTIHVQIDIDSGLHRGGIHYEDQARLLDWHEKSSCCRVCNSVESRHFAQAGFLELSLPKMRGMRKGSCWWKLQTNFGPPVSRCGT